MTIDDTKNKPISLLEIKAKKESASIEPDTEDTLKKGVDAFHEMLEEDAKSFLAIIFDENSDPRIIWAGDIDLIKTIGSIELAKSEITKKIFSYSED